MVHRSWAVVYGPLLYGGMAWSNIQVITTYEKLKMVIGSIRLQDTVGQMIEIQLTWLQLFSGLSTPMFRMKHEIPYLPQGWLVTLHRQLVQEGIGVAVSNSWVPTKQRKEDRVIMDLVWHTLPRWMWAAINRCRLFLQATTIADITTLDGRYIPVNARKVKDPIRIQKFRFPNQVRPSKQERSYWKFFVDTISSDGHLYTKLGPWVRQPDQYYEYMYAKRSEAVYKKTGPKWDVFGKTSKQGRRFRSRKFMVERPAQDSVPIRVIQGSMYILVVDEENYVSSEMKTQAEIEAINFL